MSNLGGWTDRDLLRDAMRAGRSGDGAGAGSSGGGPTAAGARPDRAARSDGSGAASGGGSGHGGDTAGGSSGGAAHGSPGYEKRDIDFRPVAIAGALLLAGCALSLLVMGWTFKYFATREAKAQLTPSTLTGLAGRGEPPEPRLQTTPFGDITKLRAMEDAELTTYGWIDRKAGVVRIPIDRAIDLVAARGLPKRAGGAGHDARTAAPSNAPSTGPGPRR